MVYKNDIYPQRSYGLIGDKLSDYDARLKPSGFLEGNKREKVGKFGVELCK